MVHCHYLGNSIVGVSANIHYLGNSIVGVSANIHYYYAGLPEVVILHSNYDPLLLRKMKGLTCC